MRKAPHLNLCFVLRHGCCAVFPKAFDLKVVSAGVRGRLGNELQFTSKLVVLRQLFLSLRISSRKKILDIVLHSTIERISP